MTGMRLGDKTDEDSCIVKIANGTNAGAGAGGGPALTTGGVPQGESYKPGSIPAAGISVDDLEL